MACRTRAFPGSKARAGVLLVAACRCLPIPVCAAETLRATVHVAVTASARGADGSREKPFPRIGDAVKHVSPGGTIIVKSGVYREHVSLPGGKPGRPTTLTAEPGERVVVCGLRRVAGWKTAGDGLFVTTLDWQPTRLFVGYCEQPPARTPNEGWWAASRAQGDTLTDPVHLHSLPENAAGAEVYVWTQTGNTFFTLPVVDLDPARGRLRVKRVSKWVRLTDGDKYRLQNHRSFIDCPGEWAVAPAGDRFRVFFRPAGRSDLNATQAAGADGSGVVLADVQHVRVAGLEVVGWGQTGIGLRNCEDVEVSRCRVAMNGRTGVQVRDSRRCTVANNLVVDNGLVGVSILYSSRVQVRHNEIAFNRMDGLIVSWKTHEVVVEGNYIHHHLWWGHPDNVQLYRDVTDVRFLDNLLLAGGQGVMMEECRNLTFRGNAVVGTGANMLIFGHHNAAGAVLEQNTLAFPGYSCLSLTARGYRLTKNVFVLGHGGVFYSLRGVEDIAAAGNLYWAAPKVQAGLPSTHGWHRTFAEFRRANPSLDVRSRYADPCFVSAPQTFAVVDARRLAQCTRARFYLRDGGRGLFAVGDHVEFNFDGVVRRVTARDEDSVRVTPPLPALPQKGWLIANWKASDEVTLDLRLKQRGGPTTDLPGAALSIPGYRRGDFDGDGRRDVPSYPGDWGGGSRRELTWLYGVVPAEGT